MVEVAGIQEAVGVALPSEAPAKNSTLNGIGTGFVVQVFNPLAVPFRGQFGRSVVQTPSLTPQQERMAQLGAPVTKDGGTQQAHVVDYVVIPPGKTLNLPGDIAQVIVRQMVNYILQTRNKGKGGLKVADPFARQEVEKEIIQNYESITQSSTKSPEEVIKQQIEELNQEETNEHPTETSFPDIGEPAPGTGVSFPSPETTEAVKPADSVSPGKTQPAGKSGKATGNKK